MSIKVLIIDDDPTIMLLHKAMVIKSNLDKQPLVFANGKKAMDYFNENNDTAAEEDYLVLLDINMPIMDGWGFLNSVQGTVYAKKLHIIMVTSSVDIADKDKAGKFPQVIAYMEKPLRIDACNKIKQFPELTTFYN